jgi:cadherin 23
LQCFQDRASEGERKSSSAWLLVRVADEEDQPPVFTFVPALTRLPESAAVGSSVLRVQALDGDRGVNRRIRYSIVRGDGDLFALQPNTGVLSVAGELDREAAAGSRRSAGYVLAIEAKEMGGNQTRAAITAQTELTIILDDVNDQQPRFAASSYDADVAEHAPIDTPIRFRLDEQGQSHNRAFDLDQGSNGTFRLLLLGDGASFFDVSPTLVANDAWFAVKVRNSSALDFERIRQFDLQLIAEELVASIPPPSSTTDPTLQRSSLDGRHSRSVALRIHLQDVNDHFPQFERDLYRAAVAENASSGTVLCTIRATDQDTGLFGTLGIRSVAFRSV